MDKWGNALKAMAPSAGDPGMGVGNQPYAAGLMSGQVPGQIHQIPGGSGGASDLYQRLQGLNNGSNARQQISQVVAGSDPSQVQPPPSSLQWTPEVQQQVMQYLMTILKQTRPGDKMTTTGGMNKNRAF